MLMHSPFLIAMFSLLLLSVASAVNAEDAALPAMPKNAGKVDADAPKTFTTTASGLKYPSLGRITPCGLFVSSFLFRPLPSLHCFLCSAWAVASGSPVQTPAVHPAAA